MDDMLKGLSVIVIGAGPGGLTFARGAQSHGADVTVIEQAGDPRGDDAGYTDRSFNLTLNQVGRRVLGDERAWSGGIDLVGRAIHTLDSDEVRYASFGDDDAAILTSVPRPTLRRNMVRLTEEKGVKQWFCTSVTALDPDKGEVTIRSDLAGEAKVSADLVVVADGVHSLADSFIEGPLHGSLNLTIEPLNYVTIMLHKDAAENMSLHHVHFWHEPDSKAVAIGLPNKDGTIAVLLASRFDGIPENATPFATYRDTAAKLKHDFPQLLRLEPKLAEWVMGRKRGRFYYKSVSNYRLGEKCVVVGDAASASPPWAGFGANTAIYSADALVRFMIGLKGDLEGALAAYENHKRILAEMVLGYAREHGEFLNKQVASSPGARPIGPVLGQLVNSAVRQTNVPEGVELCTF
jgi:kynurenine 3-monooxygenase